jgi:hypothetical protein
MGTKITALPPVITPAGTDELAISQDIGGGSRNTYKATLDQIKNYVKNTGGGTGTITDISITSPDGSIEVFGSPVTSSGTVTLNISSVGLDKLDDGGATGGEILTYNGSTSAWAASAVPKELPQTALSGQVLTFNGSTSTWVASAAPKELPQAALSGQILTYDGSTSTWVASSLSSNGFNVSLSSNGYTYLPNGIIMQWGKIYTTNVVESGAVVTFPIPFPNNCLSITTGVEIDNWSSTSGLNITTLTSNITSTNFDLVLKPVNAVAGAGSIYLVWQAIGY